MEAIQLAAFALAVGLTVSGAAATLMELAAGRRASFAPPFSVPDRVLRSLIAAFAAGPMMLFADALDARRAAAIGVIGFAGATATALLWSLALGVVLLELLSAATGATRLV